jgi:hypothetical protein
MARFVYDGTQFTAYLNNLGATPQGFMGLTQADNTGNNSTSAVGAATRTRLPNWSYGNTYGLYSSACIAEVMVAHKSNTILWGQIRDYLLGKYFGLAPGTWPKENDGNFEVISEEEAFSQSNSAMIFPAYPNPFSDNTQFGIRLLETQNVKIELIDAMGNLVSNIYSGTLSSGPIHNFSVDGMNLSSGMYVIRAYGENFTETAKIIIAR